MLTVLSNRIGEVALLMVIAWMINFDIWSFVIRVIRKPSTTKTQQHEKTNSIYTTCKWNFILIDSKSNARICQNSNQLIIYNTNKIIPNTRSSRTKV